MDPYALSENVGATFYVSGSAGMVESVVNSTSVTNAQVRRQEVNFARELDRACGTPFISYWESSSETPIVVYGNFQPDGKQATGVNMAEHLSASTHEFQSLNLSSSVPTEDGLGVKLSFTTNKVVDYQDDDTINDYSQASPVVAVTRTRRFRLGKKRKSLHVRKSDLEVFVERLRHHQARF